jgi:hypothetical protein
MSRLCLFCDNNDLSREHLWPKWLLSSLNMPSRLRPGDGGMRDSTGRSFPFTNPEHKARFVCTGCNSGWMSDLESCAAEVIRPLVRQSRQPRVLNDVAQLTVASWLTLRQMVFDTQLPSGQRYFLRDECFAFKEALTPPAPMYIWLALRIRGASRNWPLSLEIDSRPRSLSDTKGLQLTTGTIGHFTFQCATWSGMPFIDLNALGRSGWLDHTLQLWPSVNDPMWWPPPSDLTTKGLSSFRNRFRQFTPTPPGSLDTLTRRDLLARGIPS